MKHDSEAIKRRYSHRLHWRTQIR